MPNWLEQLDIPLFVSDRRLRDRRTLPRARGPWALDSGAFTQLQQYGGWSAGPTARQYAARVRRYRDEIGGLMWAAPQDWMCEPIVLAGGRVGPVRFAGTGLSVAVHQQRTVVNFLELRDLAPDLPWVPVIQGWTTDDMWRCVELYQRHGVDLRDYATVALGSVCRRQASPEIAALITELAGAGLALHAFGAKGGGLRRAGHHLVSADSLAWSYRGRRVAGCGPSHASEANCQRFALAWRERVLAAATSATTPDAARTLPGPVAE